MDDEKIIEYFECAIRKYLSSLDLVTIKKEVNKRIDLSVVTKRGKNILVEVKSSGEPSNIHKAISQLKYYHSDKNEYLVIAVPKLSENSKEICKNSGIGYIDLTGNVFIKYENILIDKIGNDKIPEALISRKRRVKDLYFGNSLRVLIQILNNPFKLFTQEELSKKLNLSKGYINRILKTFEAGIKEDGEILLLDCVNDNGLIKNSPGVQVIGRVDWVGSNAIKKSKSSLIRKTKSYIIDHPQKLLDVLIKKYKIKDNKIIAFYSFEKETNKLIEKISMAGTNNKLDYAFTLHAGASLLAPFVRFEDVYFYVKEEDIDKWANLLDLKRTEFGGNIFLVVPKYDWILEDINWINKKKVINNILLYLDLINYPKRGKEQADFLREKKIGY